MASRFLSVPGAASFQDGTADIYVASTTIANLDPSRPVRTGPTSTLQSGDLAIAEVTGLQAELDSKMGWPATTDMDAAGYNLSNVGTFGAVDGVFTGTLEAKEIVSELNVQAPVFAINVDAVDDSADSGFYSKRVPLLGPRYTGLIRDPATGIWHLFDGATLVPPTAGEYLTAAPAALSTGPLFATSLDRPDAGVLYIGTGNATSLAFAQGGVDSTFGGTVISDVSLQTPNGCYAGFFDGMSASALQIGGSVATSLLLGASGVPTTIYGDTTVKSLDVTGLGVPLNIGAGASTSAVNLSKVGATTTVAGDFVVSGTVGAALAMGGHSITGANAVTAVSLDRPSAGTLTIGGSTASAITLGKAAQTLTVPGQPTFSDLVVFSNGLRTGVVDYVGGTLVLGSPNATQVDLAQAGVLTRVIGSLQVNQAASMVSTTSLQGAVTFGTGGTSYTFPTARGSSGQVLREDGSGTPAWQTPTLPILFSSGGVMSSALFGGVWDRGAAAGIPAESQNTRHIMPIAGRITRFTWSTVSGAADSQYKISVNGVANTFTTGSAATSGAMDVGPYAVAAGDAVSIGYTNVGTVPSNSVFNILVVP